MSKNYFTLALAGLLSACGGGSDTPATATTAAKKGGTNNFMVNSQWHGEPQARQGLGVSSRHQHPGPTFLAQAYLPRLIRPDTLSELEDH